VVGRRLLLIAALVTALCAQASGAIAGTEDECADVLAAFGCGELNAETDGSDAILDAFVNPPKSPQQTDQDGPGGEGGYVGDEYYAEEDPGPRGSTDVWSGDNWQQLCGANFDGDCSRLTQPAPPSAPPKPGGPVVITLRDIASFRPTPPATVMEPKGWAVVGLPANFVADAEAQVVSGTLLGRTAEVRFTPVGYRWTHSDGAVVESASPGATWSELRTKEFTKTATSHVYASTGEYTATLEVVLSAEYRFGGSGWQSIAGVLAVAGDPVPVLVGEVDTVLTNGDCRANPSGPGC